MKQALVAAAFFLTPAQWANPAVAIADATSSPTITFRICAGWRAWRHATDLVVVCPGHMPPPGSIELREYYQVAP